MDPFAQFESGWQDDPNAERNRLKAMMASQQPAAKKGHGLLDWIPAVGGVIGGIGGGLAGSAVAPGVGTAVGGVAGAGAGQSAGKWLENLITGDKTTVGDEAKQFAYGAGGQLVGGVVGKVIGKGLGAAAGSAGALKSAGAKTLASQANVTRTLGRNLKPTEVASKLANYGVTKLDSYEPIAQQITGGSGTVSKLVREAVSKAGHVDTAGVHSMAVDLAGDPLLAASGRGKAFSDFILKGLTKANGGANGSLNGAHPLDTFDLIKTLQSKAGDIIKGKSAAMLAPEDKALAGSYRQIASELEDRLYSGAGADKVIADGKLITPEVIQSLQKFGTEHPDINTKQWGNFVKDVMGAKTVGDLRSVQAPFVRGSILAGESAAGEQAGQTLGGGLRGAAKAVPFGPNGVAAPIAAVMDSPTVNAHIGSSLFNAGDSSAVKGVSAVAAKAKAAFESPAGQRLKDLLVQQGANNAANAPDFSSPQAALPGQIDPAAAQDPSQMAGGTPTQAAADPASGYSDEQLKAALKNDIAATGGKNMDQIMQLMKLNASAVEAGQPSATQQAAISKVAGAQAVVDQIGSLFQKAGAHGRIGGIATNLAGSAGLNNDVSVYNASRAGYLSQIARALGGESGAMSDQDVKRVDALLPRVNDNPAEAAAKLQGLQDMINSRMQVAMTTVASPNQFPTDPSQVSFN